jgi:hypothetical protein
MNRWTLLADQQRQFAGLVITDSPAGPDALLRPLRGAAPRIGVYHHAYRARLIGALRSNYPVLHRALGDDDFATLALGYLAHQPSRHPSIRWFGHALVSHLAAHPDAVPHPALADLARMEWALSISFDAADLPPLAFAQLAALPPADWPAARFMPHPSVSLQRLQWAVEPIWQALTADENAATDEPQALDHELLVWRQGLETRWRSVTADEACLLAAGLAGEPFAALCEQAAEAHGAQAAAWVAGALRRWVDDGLLLWLD